MKSKNLHKQSHSWIAWQIQDMGKMWAQKKGNKLTKRKKYGDGIAIAPWAVTEATYTGEHRAKAPLPNKALSLAWVEDHPACSLHKVRHPWASPARIVLYKFRSVTIAQTNKIILQFKVNGRWLNRYKIIKMNEILTIGKWVFSNVTIRQYSLVTCVVKIGRNSQNSKIRINSLSEYHKPEIGINSCVFNL